MHFLLRLLELLLILPVLLTPPFSHDPSSTFAPTDALTHMDCYLRQQVLKCGVLVLLLLLLELMLLLLFLRRVLLLVLLPFPVLNFMARLLLVLLPPNPPSQLHTNGDALAHVL